MVKKRRAKFTGEIPVSAANPAAAKVSAEEMRTAIEKIIYSAGGARPGTFGVTDEILTYLREHGCLKEGI